MFKHGRTTLALAIALALAPAVILSTASPASAADLVSLTLNQQSSVNSGWTLSGTQTPRMVRVPGAAQEWALRLTDSTGDQTGFALYNREIPVSAGIDVTFYQSQWGGTGADGLVFFIKNAADASTTPGAIGGSLGFSFGATDGLSGALLGLGLDTYGGFAHSGVGSDCPDPDINSWMYMSRDALSLRGPGQGRQGYCHLVEPWSTTGHGSPSYAGAASRMSGARKIRVKADSTQLANPRVQVFYEDVLAIDVPLPHEFVGVEKVKLGFTAGSGGATNNHEVWALTSTVANPQLVKQNPELASTGESASAEISLLALAIVLSLTGVGLAALRRRKQL